MKSQEATICAPCGVELSVEAVATIVHNVVTRRISVRILTGLRYTLRFGMVANECDDAVGRMAINN